MKAILLKLALTLLMLFIILIDLDAFYSAVILGNQLAYASITAMGLTIGSYLVPLITACAGLTVIWRKR